MNERYVVRISGNVRVEGEEEGTPPMAAIDLVYRDVGYRAMAVMEEKFFVEPLVELNKMAKSIAPRS